ncbi:MAG: YcxB family protein [Clostridia bacterium]|nr:YcxB family protein [Clostridia bacterium]
MAEQEKVVVTSGLKRGDYRRLTYWNMFGKKPVILPVLVMMLLIGAACILFGRHSTNAYLIGIILAACPVLIIGMMELNIFNVLRKGQLEARTTATYTVDRTGIIARSPAAQYPLAYNWRDVEGVYENSRFYIIFINKIQMMTLRKTDVDAAQRALLMQLVKKYVPAQKIHLK